MANVTYEIQYSNGERDGGYTSHAAAKAAVEERLGLDCEIGHSGDLSDGGDATLFWASEEDAENDSGARAAGKIIKITPDDERAATTTTEVRIGGTTIASWREVAS